jgi:long-chain acyl-CoA synthetase
MVYTSGTTRKPKGVMLSHHNNVTNVHAARELFPIDHTFTALFFLPLGHAYERMVDFLYFHQGTTVDYAESVSTLGEDLNLVNPLVFVSVPRVFEKVIGTIQEYVARESGAK